MEAKHTPGPWRTEPDGLYVLATNGQYSDGEERTLMVAKVERHRPGSADRLPMDPEREANYSLIAAAPDLLAACEALVFEQQYYEHHTQQPGRMPGNNSEKFMAVVVMAQAAIAKATGKEAGSV